MSKPFFQWQGDNLLLHCHIQPGAKSSGFSGQHGHRLKVRIAAPPAEGKANTALIAFVASQFDVAKHAVSITSGEQSRQKTLKIAAPKQIPEGLGITGPTP